MGFGRNEKPCGMNESIHSFYSCIFLFFSIVFVCIQIRGKRCATSPSEDNDTLFLGNICISWTKEAVSDLIKIPMEINQLINCGSGIFFDLYSHVLYNMVYRLNKS